MIYEYKCRNCAMTFEVNTTMSRRNEIQGCPKCLRKEGLRVFSPSIIAMGGTNAEKLARLDDNLKYSKK